MSSNASQPKKQKSQVDKFIEAARELGCNEDESAFSAFDEIVKKVAKAPPPRNKEEKATKPTRPKKA
jgi:hypothetical protein